ncbi:LPS translocon maturation chaperone LptM [Paraburkholderia sp. GAS334]|uniref:LPS translocon maturation chaperone LptM n=1 Tax=unclassified Paraburkholderia TaxID=2615204 RepID=UPI003D1DE762
MRVAFRMSAAAPRAIVAALAIFAGATLGGCGQRGPLYLPTVPPLPAKPNEQTQPPSPDEVRPDAETASSDMPASTGISGTVPDTSGKPLSLSPDSELRTAPNEGASPATTRPASGASSDQ